MKGNQPPSGGDRGGPQLRGAAADHRLALAGALADPTRLKIYGILEDAAAGCTGPHLDVATLTGLLGMHHSTVRAHLIKLRDAGLIMEWTAAPSGRGRPKLLYRCVDPARDSLLG